MRYAPIMLLMAGIMFSCDTNRVFEKHRDFEEDCWPQEQVITFEFEIEDVSIPYDIYAHFRNASAYPYHNLYYQYSLLDSSGNKLVEELQNINLFDPKTGEPYGSGLGDLFDHQQLVIDNYSFRQPGMYTVEFEQYMRRDTLPLILSVGARVEWAQSTE